MEPLFKNKTVMSRENYIHLLEFHQKKNNWKYWLYTAFFSVSFIFCTAVHIVNKNYSFALLFFLFFFGFLLYRFIEPYRKTEKELQSDKIQNNLVNYYFFYEKCFKVKNKLGNNTVKYHKLYKAYENENYFYLYLNKNVAFIIDKSGFTIGNEKSFEKFLKNKMWFKFKTN